MEAIGIIRFIGSTQKVSERVSKREFVVDIETSISDSGQMVVEPISFVIHEIPFNSMTRKCSMLDGLNVNDKVKVSFNLSGRMWDGHRGINYFNSLECWRVVLVNKD